MQKRTRKNRYSRYGSDLTDCSITCLCSAGTFIDLGSSPSTTPHAGSLAVQLFTGRGRLLHPHTMRLDNSLLLRAYRYSLSCLVCLSLLIRSDDGYLKVSTFEDVFASVTGEYGRYGQWAGRAAVIVSTLGLLVGWLESRCLHTTKTHRQPCLLSCLPSLQHIFLPAISSGQACCGSSYQQQQLV